MCEYDVDCEAIADLRDDAARTGHDVSLDDLGCGWLTYQLAGKAAPSWRVADRLKGAGHSGILVPSFVPGATAANVNLVPSGLGHRPAAGQFQPQRDRRPAARPRQCGRSAE